ncbi:MAG: M3 family metallopeptidase [Muribaculaceae bacterium]|nr:M3 family metallopeptidase [Muribaculaceae bacterium]
MKTLIMNSFAFLSLLTVVSSCDSGGTNNPLIKKSTAPYEAIPFDKISVADMEEAVMEGIKLQNEEIAAITDSKEEPTFENTIAAFDRSGKVLNRAILTLSNLESALGDTAIMNTMAKVTPELSHHSTDILLNHKLWDRIKKVYDSKGERTDLSSEALRLIDETYRSFAESGANLEGEKREQFRKINQKLSDLTVKFGQNVTNEMSSPDKRIFVTEEETKGLPEDIKAAARSEAKAAFEANGESDNENLYLFTVFGPSYTPFMKYADNREKRKELYQKYNSRNVGGEFDNTQVLIDIANTRLELAKLMGKNNFAEYQLQGTMASTPEKVMNLLEQLRVNYTEPMKGEIKEIENYARQTQGHDFILMPWDYSYWANKLKNDRYAFNDEDLKPYFDLNHTIDGVLGLATRLYGYTFKENNEIPVYHPDVKVFEVYESDGSLLGLLYADFYYRAGKAPGAWMTEFRGETKDDNGNREIPLISIVTNFSKPVGDEPVLLTPYEVETFLHEFGHALHGLSSQATYASLSGTNVYHDFVELFSQFNENFLTEEEFLDGFARHYQTGDKIPAELIEKFVNANQFGAAYACMRQLGFGYLDMAYHTINEPIEDGTNVEIFEEKAQDPVRIFNVVEGCFSSPSFGHIFSGGYAAGYYGYKWAEVLDADAFAAFQEEGVFNPAPAKRFKKMLQSGGTVDPTELYREFRGKDASVDALLKRDGITKK